MKTLTIYFDPEYKDFWSDDGNLIIDLESYIAAKIRHLGPLEVKFVINRDI
jgi:hypothetical protein